MRVLENERIWLRPVGSDDLAALLELRWDQDVMTYLVHEPLSSGDQHAWLQRVVAGGDLAMCILAKTDGDQAALAGTIGLYDFNRRHQRACLRLRLSPAYQGKGLAFQAGVILLDYGFNTLNLHKIYADSFSDNEPIVRFYLRIGMVSEGVARDHYFHRGCFRDATRFSILRDEFKRVEKRN
jgi:RimJ/RimL family protein N-acetyltransferase